MATAQDGTNPGRSGQPQRQSPARKNSGRGTNAEPTSPSNQAPSEIFGASTGLGGTGLGGSAGRGTPGDVTQVSDQTLNSLTGRKENHADTTLEGSAGSHPASGGESITYTDPFGVAGGVNRDVTTQGDVATWTEASNAYGSSTMPGVAGNQPTHTGLGHGRIRGAGKGL